MATPSSKQLYMGMLGVPNSCSQARSSTWHVSRGPRTVQKWAPQPFMLNPIFGTDAPYLSHQSYFLCNHVNLLAHVFSMTTTGQCDWFVGFNQSDIYYRIGSIYRLYSNISLPQITAYFGDKKFQLFGVFIDSSAAPWHTDSKYIYMSILNIIATE